MDYNYYTLWYYLTVVFGYILVAGMAFTAGWIFRIRKTERVIKEIDGFALYKVAVMIKEKNNARIKKEKWRQRPFTVFKG